MGTEKTETQTQEQAQEQAKTLSLHQQLRKAKKAKDKILILEAALEAAKIKAAEDAKADEERKVNKDRRLRAKHLYSMGVALEYLAKANNGVGVKIFSSLLCDSPLADKDFARLCEAIFWLNVGIVLEDDLMKKYDKIKEQQKAKAELMRNKKAQKRAAEAAPE